MLLLHLLMLFLYSADNLVETIAEVPVDVPIQVPTQVPSKVDSPTSVSAQALTASAGALSTSANVLTSFANAIGAFTSKDDSSCFFCQSFSSASAGASFYFCWYFFGRCDC